MDRVRAPQNMERGAPCEPTLPCGTGRQEKSTISWIVVVTWNGADVVGACLDSLGPARANGHEVVVVDNGSTDGTPELVERGYPGVALIRNGRNLGFAGGNNVGIRYAMSRGAHRVVLLNQDVTIAPDCIEELGAAADRHPEAGTVSAKIFHADRPETIWFAGATFSTWSGRTRDIGSGARDRGQFDSETTIQRGTACTMLVTEKFLEVVGLFDEALFLYGEEMDLALRAHGSGLVNLFAPRARAWHRVSTSTGGTTSGRYLYYHTRNMLYLLDKHRPLRGRARSTLRRALVVAVMLASIVTMGTRPLTSIRGVIAGARDFARRRMGERPKSRATKAAAARVSEDR